jgi:kynurenine formamidase
VSTQSEKQPTKAVPTEEEVRGWFSELTNWGRWGPSDMRGTLNFITEEKRQRASALFRDGVTVSLARPVEFEPSPDVPVKFARRLMERTGDSPESTGASDSLLVSMHGGARTHVDSPCHVFWQSKMFNGQPASAVTVENGASIGDISVAAGGVVTRGVLLDIARLKGKRWLEPGEPIFPVDLEAAESSQNVTVEEGDVLLVRTGHTARRQESPVSYGAWPGLHAACIPWLAERAVAAIGTDSANDVSPSGYANIGLPIHELGIAALGLWLIDHCDHEALGEMCKELGRYEFLFVMSPLNLPSMTGSLVNPLALF